MNKFLELITVPIAAGGQSRFELSGDYFEIIDSAYPVTVLLEDRNGAQIGRMSGAEASYFLRDTPYTAITIASAQAQTVRIAFGSGEAGTRRTSGVVQVVDGEKSRTLAGLMFMGNASTNPVAAQFSYCQLWNPSADKNLIVSALTFSTTTAQGVGLGFHTVALANNQATQVINKRQGSAAGVGQVRSETFAAQIGFNAGFQGYMPNNILQQFKPAGVLVVPPGRGLTAYAQSLNTPLTTFFEWFEDPI